MRNIVIKIFIFLFFFVLSGCSSKRVLTLEEFNSKMSDKEYSVADLSDGKNQVALAVGNYYQVYYYCLNSEKKVTNTIKKEVNSLKYEYNNIKHYIKGNYEKYEIVNDRTYTVYSRIQDTYIYVSVTKNYRTDVDKILEYLGY